MTALIDKTKLSEDEKRLIRAEVKELFHVYRTQDEMTPEQIQKFYMQWMRIAERVYKGSIMVDTIVPLTEEKKNYVDDLCNLYTFMLRLIGIYDYIFSAMLTNENHIRRSKNKIMAILTGQI